MECVNYLSSVSYTHLDVYKRQLQYVGFTTAVPRSSITTLWYYFSEQQRAVP